ncbi:hypothetical protein BX600DRAFT_503160 [Xylariales sp. PMI_506]|nr:hypothetical protein BX600DRAFT_503160 [Xylariales sp. PMI_506]
MVAMLGSWRRKDWHRRALRWIVISTLWLIFAFLAFSSHLFHRNAPEAKEVWMPRPRDAAANSTLGFERLLALSPGPSWRTRGLAAATNLTGLNFTIPMQPQNPDVLVQAFREMGDDDDTKPKHGSAKAWLAHLDLLKFVIASGFETALIVEDDLDWDVRIKEQMALVSDGVRHYTGVAADDPAPFGTSWDVLWLGHCGSAIEKRMPRQSYAYPDDTRIANDEYFGWSKRFLQRHLADGHRNVQASVRTVCSFAYAVHRKSAQKVLDRTARGADQAFDVALDTQCATQALRCIVINPQIFQHYEPPFDRGYISDVRVADGKGKHVDEAEFEGHKGLTRNILRSARCEALFQDVCP